MGKAADRAGTAGSRRVIGLTGNVAVGKSTVTRLLRAKGVHVIDMDRMTHRALRRTGPGYEPVVRAFGAGILDEVGAIDRGRLGSIVFADPDRLRQLERILHPIVFGMAQEELARMEADVAVIEAIKLLEAGTTRQLCEEVWVVASDEDIQLERMRRTRGLSAAESRKRIANQSSQAWKLARADRVIVNRGTLEDLSDQVDAVWTAFLRHETAGTARGEA